MQLKKYGLNLISVTALGIGSVVGAGIFALLGQVIMMAGDQTYYAFIIAGVAALFSGYSYSRLAAAYPDSGGLTDYFHIAFKKRWVVGTFSLIYMMTSAVSICMMAKSFGIYAVKLFPHVQDTNFFINAAACFLIVGLAALNMQRSKDIGNTEIVMVSIKMGILLSLIIAALIHYDIAEKMQTIPYVVASTNATAVLLSLIRDGNGVSLHPIGSASREKDLVFLSELGYEEEHDFWIATRKDYVQRPEVKVLIECIRDATLKI